MRRFEQSDVYSVRKLLLYVAALMILLSFFCFAEAEETRHTMNDKINGVGYKIEYSYLDDGTVSFDHFQITDSSEIQLKKITKYQIPDQIDGRTVTAIGHDAFNLSGHYEYLETIIIPESITDIGYRAFLGCFAMKSVKLPEGVKHLGQHAFGCAHLQKINIPDSLTVMDGNPFHAGGPLKISISKKHPVFRVQKNELINIEKGSLVCYLGNKQKSYQIPEGITEIEAGAFSSCDELIKLSMPDTVRRIGREAFEGCSLLTSIHLSESLEEIGDRAFWFCGRLSEMTLPASVSRVGENPFRGCYTIDLAVENGREVMVYHHMRLKVSPDNEHLLAENNVLYSLDDHRLVSCLNDELAEYRVREGTEQIGAYAFYGDNTIRSLILPESLTALGVNSFCVMKKLNRIEFRGGIKVIPWQAFATNERLITVVLPEGLERIETGAFHNCEELKNINFPDSLIAVEENAFWNCPLVEVPERFRN